MVTRSSRRATAHEEAVARRLRGFAARLADEPDDDAWDDEPVDGHTRVRARADPWGAGAREDDTASTSGSGERAPVPVPGRHAARGRLGVGQSQLAVVAAVVLLGTLATVWWLTTGHPDEVALPPTVASSPTSPLSPADVGSTGSASAAGAGLRFTSGPAGSVTVDVAGKVRRPGIVVLPAGSRVVDAVHSAGGARAGVDLTPLNLARVLVDGEQIVVGSPVPTTASGGPADPAGTLVNLNTADVTSLESLPDVGPVTAHAILTWRAEHGGFTSVEQLLDVDGIGEATLAKLTPFVTL